MTMTAQRGEILNATALLRTGRLRKFIGQSQRDALLSFLRGEEGEWFAETLIALDKRIAEMSHTYQQEGMGENAIVHLHYFGGGQANWYITEKDMYGEVSQAFGHADLFGDGGELGYISITELVEADMEIDLHWSPKTLKEATA